MYLILAAGRQVGLDALVESWTPSYDLLVHVPILEEPSPDGICSSDPAFQWEVEERLGRELARPARLEPLRLDPGCRAGWLDAVEAAVLERLRPAQMQLL